MSYAQRKYENFGDLTTFLAHCARIARLSNGWVSVKDAQAQGVENSADRALQSLREGAAVEDVDIQRAKDAIEAQKAVFEKHMQRNRSTDFAISLHIIIKDGYVATDTYRIAAALIGMTYKSKR